MESISKISLKSIGAQPAAHSIKTQTLLAHIYGNADRMLNGASTFGTFVKFIGTFEAINMQTGESFRSSNLLAPPILQDEIVNALLAAGAKAGKTKTPTSAQEDGTPATAPVEFAVAISARPVENKSGVGVGYEYTITPLVPFKDADTLNHLRAAAQPKEAKGAKK